MKYIRIRESFDGEKCIWEDEDAILDEAFSRLDEKLRKKFEAYEEGYALYFKDFEQWFERYAPKIWADVYAEVFDEERDAQMQIAEERMERARLEKENEEYNRMIDREYHRDRI